MLGIDYSPQSVKFARAVAEAKNFDQFTKFDTADIFQADWSPGKFDIALDKGTLDAIALSDMKFKDGKTVTEIYANVIENILVDNGVFLITSCNFTEKELVEIIETDNLKVWKTINYPSFEFGGVKGAAVCTVAFIKN